MPLDLADPLPHQAPQVPAGPRPQGLRERAGGEQLGAVKQVERAGGVGRAHPLPARRSHLHQGQSCCDRENCDLRSRSSSGIFSSKIRLGADDLCDLETMRKIPRLRSRSGFPKVN